MSDSKLKGIYILEESSLKKIYGSAQRAELEDLLDLSAGCYSSSSIQKNLPLLNDIDIILSGWGGPRMDRDILEAAPKLKAIFYGAGSVRGIVTPEFWKANIPITSACAMNAIPVAEYTLSQILFCLKLGWQHNQVRGSRTSPPLPVHGAYRSTIGLISLGTIAKLVRKLLRYHDIEVLVYDPYVDEQTANQWGVERVTLEALFQRSAVVSLHTPDLPETKGMIRREHFEALPKWASFINTARSATVCHTELCDVLENRPDLWAVLDVTEDASEDEYQRLVNLGNVTITPHIAGSLGPECQRMGQLMIDELRRFLNGDPLEFQITEEQARIMA